MILLGKESRGAPGSPRISISSLRAGLCSGTWSERMDSFEAVPALEAGLAGWLVWLAWLGLVWLGLA